MKGKLQSWKIFLRSIIPILWVTMDMKWEKMDFTALSNSAVEAH